MVLIKKQLFLEFIPPGGVQTRSLGTKLCFFSHCKIVSRLTHSFEHYMTPMSGEDRSVYFFCPYHFICSMLDVRGTDLRSVRSSCSTSPSSPGCRRLRWGWTGSRRWWSRGSPVCWPPSFGWLEVMRISRWIKELTGYAKIFGNRQSYLRGPHWKRLRRWSNPTLRSPWTGDLSFLEQDQTFQMPYGHLRSLRYSK